MAFANVDGNIELLVNNRYRTPGHDAYSFSIDLPFLPETMSCNYAISVDAVTIENVLPVIQENVNDLLWFEFNGVATSIQIQEGNYDVYDLIDTIKATLVDLDPGFDMIYEDKQKKILLVVPADVTFVLLRTHETPFDYLNYTLPNNTDRLLEVLGWSFQQANRLNLYTPGSIFTWIPPNLCRVRSTSILELCVDRHIDQIWNTNPKAADRTIARIPHIHPYGTIEHYQKQNLQELILTNANGISLNFSLTDEWGDRRFVGQGKNAFLTFQLKLRSLVS
jgi:hypothetical protein